MDDQEDLHVYLEKIRLELAERESRLAGVEKEISEIEFKLKESRSAKVYLQGRAAGIIAAESFRNRLRAELERKIKHRRLLQEEVAKARERQQDVRTEIELREGES